MARCTIVITDPAREPVPGQYRVKYGVSDDDAMRRSIALHEPYWPNGRSRSALEVQPCALVEPITPGEIVERPGMRVCSLGPAEIEYVLLAPAELEGV